MDFKISFPVNETIYIRDPESGVLGKKIVKCAIDLIYNVGFENFTFKKLAVEAQTTEASIYRYFENKHRLLLYILSFYWSYLSFLLEFQLQNMTNAEMKLKIIISLLTNELPESANNLDYNKKFLNQIVIAESNKVYLVKEVNEINKSEVFKPYKDLCGKIAEVILLYNPKYKYPKSLSSSMVEIAHLQQFFSLHLTRLTDIDSKNKSNYTANFLEHLVFKALEK